MISCAKCGGRVGVTGPCRTCKKRAKQLDAEVERIYYRNCSGIQIDVMDISKVFAVGRAALTNGLDAEAAVVAFVETIRKN